MVVCGLSYMMKELNKLSYDTFQLGDFYVPTMLFKNVIFRKSPVMSTIFMLHERKIRINHDELMKIAAAQIPYLVKGKNIIPLVTDNEKGFTEAINDNLTKVRRFLCWNHVINSAKAWLPKYGALVTMSVTFGSCSIKKHRKTMKCDWKKCRKFGARHLSPKMHKKVILSY